MEILKWFVAYWENEEKAELGIDGITFDRFKTENEMQDKLEEISILNALTNANIQIMDSGYQCTVEDLEDSDRQEYLQMMEENIF